MDVEFYKNLLDTLEDMNLRFSEHGLDINYLRAEISATISDLEDKQAA